MTPETIEEQTQALLESLRKLATKHPYRYPVVVNEFGAQVLIGMLDQLANGFYRNAYSISDDGYSVVTPLSQEDWEVYALSCKIIGETPDPQLKPKELE